MSAYVLAIDQGTTGSTAVLVGQDGEILARANHEFPQHFPKPGWVEHDLDEIWASVTDSIRDVVASARVALDGCRAIGITNQRETTVVWDRATGEPIHRAIVWQDRRTADRCQALSNAGLGELIRDRTGLVIDPYFSATKIAWILDAIPGARARAEAGDLCFGTIDSWLVHRLCGGASHSAPHLTDATNASRTMLYDLHSGDWSEELCEHLNVPYPMLPEVRGCSEVFAVTRGVSGLPDGIPVAGMAGDQQAALFGQTCFEEGDAKCTYGTGAFLLVNTGSKPAKSSHGLISTVAWRLGEETTFALEGSAFIAGAAVQWLRDGLGLLQSSSEIESLARSVEDSGGVVFVPALAGLGAPHWDPDARGVICGISRGTTVAHLARATLEGIAFQIADLAEAMQLDSGRSVRRLRVDGGAARNDLLMQFQADLLDVTIDRPATVETTALGAAYLAGLAVGMFRDLPDVARSHRVERSFEAAMTKNERAAHQARWKQGLRRTRTDMGDQ